MKAYGPSIVITISSSSMTSPALNLFLLRNSWTPFTFTRPSSTIILACPPVWAICSSFNNLISSMYSSVGLSLNVCFCIWTVLIGEIKAFCQNCDAHAGLNDKSI